jgi:sugar phosphate isomerase/epimerase
MTGNNQHDYSRLCIHTITTRPWAIEKAAVSFAKAGVRGISVWRDALQGREIAEVRRLLESLQLDIVSLCRGGFFPSTDPKRRSAAIDDNLKAIDEAASLGAPLVVLVCGSAPDQSLAESRKQIKDGIAACLGHAKSAKVRLAIEPLHPMYAAERSAINTLEQANDMAESLNSPWVGIALDVYHVWWDPDLEKEIMRCGRSGNLAAFHICDWKSPMLDMLNDRGLMGEGCINIRQISNWVDNAGFSGFREVEIFSTSYWQQDQEKFLEKIKLAYLEHI